jgi:acyl-CoA synthetase (AMP-forming)/AMP-acid ligase II
LEQICGIFPPILAGADVIVAPDAGAALFGGPPAPLVAALARHAPAPPLLALWVAGLTAMGMRAPPGLRLVAVGGAPFSAALLARGLTLGIPVRAEYELPEACSVVALNRPDYTMPGTPGRVLDGLTVAIEDGEIVLRGPTLMQLYLGPGATPEIWRTADLGRLEDCRRDAMIMTPAGRNIPPDWVEGIATADLAIACAALVQVDGELTLALAPGAPVDPDVIETALQAPPRYARPAAIVVVDPRAPGLIRPSGAPDRAVARDLMLAVRAADTTETAR